MAGPKSKPPEEMLPQTPELRPLVGSVPKKKAQQPDRGFIITQTQNPEEKRTDVNPHSQLQNYAL